MQSKVRPNGLSDGTAKTIGSRQGLPKCGGAVDLWLHPEKEDGKRVEEPNFSIELCLYVVGHVDGFHGDRIGLSQPRLAKM